MAARNPSTIPAIERIARLAWRIAQGEAVTRAVVEREFGVSRATAKRDLALLDRVLRDRKLHPGGQPPRRLVIIEEPRRVIRLLGAD